MANNTVFFPGYSAGENAYKEIDKVCSPYGTKAVVISDEISINATKKYLDEATQDGIVKIDYILFPGEASFEAVEDLEQNEIVKNADMIFCLGGGKAIDTGKLLAHRMNKPYFTFPTIASTCACNSALGFTTTPTMSSAPSSAWTDPPYISSSLQRLSQKHPLHSCGQASAMA